MLRSCLKSTAGLRAILLLFKKWSMISSAADALFSASGSKHLRERNKNTSITQGKPGSYCLRLRYKFWQHKIAMNHSQQLRKIRYDNSICNLRKPSLHAEGWTFMSDKTRKESLFLPENELLGSLRHWDGNLGMNLVESYFKHGCFWWTQLQEWGNQYNYTLLEIKFWKISVWQHKPRKCFNWVIKLM